MVTDDQDVISLARTMMAERGELLRYRVVGLPDSTGEDTETNRWEFARSAARFGGYPILDRATGRMF